jgi:hypothetical protein
LSLAFLSLLVACANPPEPPPPSPDGKPGAAAPADPVGEAAPATEAPPSAAGASTHYGAPFSQTASLTASALIANPAAHVGQPVRVEGRVAEVCQKAGCWMVLSGDEGATLRVRMKDHAFGVDKDCAGGWATVEGTVVEREVSVEEAEHVASEAAHAEAAPKPGKIFELEATGVEIKRS